ncbi:MFS transporter [Streptomyces sp. B1866]|uniref:MFS transporter n=1 Tax=Streptomyces sp. B1866 TaxID=3075431 RepID=UPI00288DB8F2|nr:MFS transporter [Streptomyces sp. B1866]MDT3399621.1 MFS transporter [Streptomyces sp. B1866]
MPNSAIAAKWLRVVLPPVGPLRRYALVSFVDATGTGMFLTVSVLFFTRIVGLGAGAVASGLSLAGLAAMIAAVPLGSLGDRFGYRRIWVLLTAVQAVVFAVYPFVRTFPEFVTLAVIAALAEVGGSPIRGAYLSRMAGQEQRVRARAYNQAVVNGGIAVGALAAGIALGVGTRAAYVSLMLADAASFAIAAVILLTMPAASAARSAPSPRSRAGRPRSVLRDLRYLTVCVLNGLLMTYAAILTVALPLWIVRHTHAPTWTVAGTFLVNTFLVVTLQVRASRGTDTVRGAARGVLKSGALLLVACLVLASTGALPALGAVVVLGIGCVLLTLAEMLQSAGGWGLSYELAPEDRQGEYLGAFAMGTRIYDSLGPILVTVMILGLGRLGWVLLGVLYAGLAFGLSAAAHWARRARSVSVEDAVHT